MSSKLDMRYAAGPKTGGRPRMLLCYLCGREYGSRSLGIHIPQCQKKWKDRENLKPFKDRRPLPQQPFDLKDIEGLPQNQVERFNDRMYQVWDSQALLKCEHCHRTFVPEALAKHQKSCTPSRPARPVGYFRDAKAAAVSSPPSPAPVKLTRKTKAFLQRQSPARPATSFARSVSRSRQAPGSPPEMERPSTSGGRPGPPRPQPQRSPPRLAAYNTPTQHRHRGVPSLDPRAEPDKGEEPSPAANGRVRSRVPPRMEMDARWGAESRREWKGEEPSPAGGYIYTAGPASPPKQRAKGPACHECGGAYPRSGSKFCAACGTARRRASKLNIAALVWGAFCDECGRPFAAQEKFCSACGVERSLLPPS